MEGDSSIVKLRRDVLPARAFISGLPLSNQRAVTWVINQEPSMQEDKIRISRYANFHGYRQSVRNFAKEFPLLNEIRIRR